MFDRFQQLTGAAVIGALAVLAPAAMAADQGAISDTASEGRLDVTLELPDLVRISDLQDIDLGTFDGTALDGSDDVCVWATTERYSITATGDGGGDFTLTGNTNGDVVDYAVEWAESAGQTSGTPLTSGISLGNRANTATSTDCNGGNDPNATVIVAVAEDDLAAVPADSYSGTLTLLVAPE